MKKIFAIPLGFCLLTSMTNVFAASTDQQIATLQKQMKQQQRQLAKQRHELNQLASGKSTVRSRSYSQVVKTKSKKVAIPTTRLVLGDSKANLSLSGQISAVSFYANDGKQGYIFYGNNDISNSRLNFDSELQPTKGWKIGSHIQFGFNLNPSNTVSQTTPSPAAAIDMRKVEVYVQSKRYGALFFGKGDTASDDTAHSDLSGTNLVGRSTLEDIGGGLLFRISSTGALSTVAVGDVVNGLDGFSRLNRIRYDTPSFHGFNLAASADEGNRQDVALKFDRNFSGTQVVAQIALGSSQGLNTGTANVAEGNQLNGSASVLFPVGVSLTGASGTVFARQSGRDNPHYYYLKPGYQRKFSCIGLTALSVDMGQYYNFAQNGDRADSYGVQALQNINAWSLAVYTGYRHFALHRSGTPFDAMNLLIFGALYKF